jgi:hypothetical protein
MVNYIPDAETNVSDVTFSANVTLTPTVVDIIRGTQSFNSVYSSSATVADYTQWAMNDVDLVDLGKELTISFEYSADAGVSTGDFEVVVRNLDSAVDITILDADLNFTGGHGSPTKFVGKFQTDGVDNTYALRIRPTFSFGTARTLKVDNVQVGPAKLLPGAIVTARQSFAGSIIGTGGGTLNVGTGGGALQSMSYSRYGEDILIRYNVKIGTSGATDVSNAYLFPVPTGIILDQDTYDIVGYGDVTISGSANPVARLTAKVFSSRIIVNRTDISLMAGGDGVLFTNANQVSIFVRAKVVGWAASNLISSQENLFSTANFSVLGGLQSIPHQAAEGSETKIITFGGASVDTTSSWDVANSQYIIPKTGNYNLNISLIGTATAGSFATIVKPFVNGVSIDSRFIRRDLPAGGFGEDTMSNSRPIKFNKGDLVDVRVFQNSGVAYNIYSPWFSLTEIPDFSVFGVAGETELIEATIGGFPWSSSGAAANQYGDFMAITIPPGEWDLSFNANWRHNIGAGLGVTDIAFGISAEVDNSFTDRADGDNAIPTTSNGASVFEMGNHSLPVYNVTVTTATTYNLKGISGIVNANLNFAGGKISARRVK